MSTPIKHTDLFDFDSYKREIKAIQDLTVAFAGSMSNLITILNQRSGELIDNLKGFKTLISSTKDAEGLAELSKTINSLGNSLNSVKEAGKNAKKSIEDIDGSTSDLKKKSSELEKKFYSLSESERNNQEVVNGLLDEYKTLNQVISSQKKVLNDAKKEVDLATGSYNKLSKDLLDMKKELKAMPNAFNASTGEINKNNKAAVELSDKIKKADASLKKMDSGMGVYTRNVGNYASAFDDMPGPIQNAGGAIKGFSAQLKAMMANPVVAVIAGFVLVFMALVKAFKSTDSGANAFASKLEQIKAVVDVVRQRVAAMAQAVINIFKGNWKEAVQGFKDAFSGIKDQMKAATEAAEKYTYALDALQDAENNYISKRAENENKIARLEYKAQNRANSLTTRRNALKEAIKLSEEEAIQAKKFAEEKLKTELDYLAGKNKVRAEDILSFIKMTDAEQANASSSIKNIRNNYEELFKEIEELYAKTIQEDTKFFEENKRNISKLSAFDEEAQKERLTFIKQTETIRLNMLKDGREKEIAQAKATLNQELNAITANTKEANDLRTALNDQYKKQVEDINKEFNEKELSSLLKAEEERINLKIQLFKENSDEFLKESLNLLEVQKRQELLNTELTETQKANIIEKYRQEAIKLNDNFNKAQAESDMQGQLDRLNGDLLAAQRSGKETILIKKQILMQERDMALYLAQDNAEAMYLIWQKYYSDIDELRKEDSEKEQVKWKTFIQSTIELASGLNQIFQNGVESRIRDIERERDYSISAAGDSAEAKKRIEEAYNRRIRAEKRKAAVAEKNLALFTAGINTATAVINGLNTKPFFPVGVAMAVLAGVMGGVQIAAISSKPLPQFRKGTDNAPEGLAVINDEPGSTFRELILRDNKAYLPSKRNQVVHLHKGDKVIPATKTAQIIEMAERSKELQRVLANQALNDTLVNSLDKGRKLEIEHSMANAMVASKTDERYIVEGIGKKLAELPIQQHIMDESGYQKRIRKGNTIVNYLNQRNSLK